MTDSAAHAAGDITLLLKRASRGENAAQEELFPLIYRELKRLAASQLAGERRDHTLEPTALLHEAYVRLVQVRDVDWASRGHFFAVAAKIMRRLLISHARAHMAEKRGGGMQRVDLDHALVMTDGIEPTLIALDDALSRLESESPRAYQLVELRFFAGLGFDEAAQVLNVSARTLRRDWDAAKRWLYREIQGETLPGSK